jgi:protein-S-isoprenylcysteine O-methyltransferase Ste14
MIETIRLAALAAALISAGSLGGLLGVSLVDNRFVLWPAPDRESWRFKLSFGLFRVFCGATIVFALADWGSLGWAHWSRLAIGVPVMVGSFWALIYCYWFLGIDNTYCGEDGLVTRGIYAYSRNPQYVASVIATAALAVTTGSAGALGLTVLLLALYTLFALNEERWLRERYNAAFRRYVEATPRFLDARSVRRVRADLAAAI